VSRTEKALALPPASPPPSRAIEPLASDRTCAYELAHCARAVRSRDEAIALLKAQLDAARDQVSNARSEVASARREAASRKAEVRMTQVEVEALRSELARARVALHRKGIALFEVETALEAAAERERAALDAVGEVAAEWAVRLESQRMELLATRDK